MEHKRLKKWFKVLEDIPKFGIKENILKEVFESLDQRIKEDIVRSKLRIYISPPLRKGYENKVTGRFSGEYIFLMIGKWDTNEIRKVLLHESCHLK